MILRLMRSFLIPVLLVVAMGSCVVIAALILTKPVKNNINPLETFVLRIALSTRDQALQTAAGTNSQPSRFVIGQGDTAATIGANLKAQGLITDSDLFRNYVRYFGLDSQLQAGTYFLRQTYTIPQVAVALTNAGASTVSVQVIEGWRMEEIAKAIDNNPLLAFKGVDFLRLVGTGAAVPTDFALRVGLPAGRSLEGFLFPATYTLPADAPADELVTRMLNHFNEEVTDKMKADAAGQGLTLYQAITLASIVEREAVVNEERPIIAGVYLNRRRKPMTLDADPTVQYALGNSRDTSTWWPQITQSDYQGVDSPYNTYRNEGLPPGPIANPGLASIQASIYPQASNYFYFRADCAQDGHHKFAETFAEQTANGC